MIRYSPLRRYGKLPAFFGDGPTRFNYAVLRAPTDGAYISADGSNVSGSTLTDIIASNNLTGSATLTKGTTPNGKETVIFSGSAPYLYKTLGTPITLTGCTIFVVTYGLAAGPYSGTLVGLSGATSPPGHTIKRSGNTTTMYAATGGVSNISPVVSVDNEWSIFVNRVGNGTNQNWIHRPGGVVVTGSAYAQTMNFDCTHIGINTYWNGTDYSGMQGWGNPIAEVLIYTRAQTDWAMAQTVAYLRDKYAI